MFTPIVLVEISSLTYIAVASILVGIGNPLTFVSPLLVLVNNILNTDSSWRSWTSLVLFPISWIFSVFVESAKYFYFISSSWCHLPGSLQSFPLLFWIELSTLFYFSMPLIPGMVSPANVHIINISQNHPIRVIKFLLADPLY